MSIIDFIDAIGFLVGVWWFENHAFIDAENLSEPSDFHKLCNYAHEMFYKNNKDK